MKDSLQRDLYKTYLRFYETNNLREKLYIIGSLIEVLEAFPNDDNLVNMHQVLSMNLEKNYLKIQQIILDKEKDQDDFIEKNSSLIKSIIPKDEGIDKIVTFDNYSSKNLIQILYDFLSTISVRLLHFVKKKFDDGQLLINRFSNREYDGFVGLLGGKKLNSYIYVNNLHNLMDLLVLVHEIGHAYFDEINNIDFLFFDDYNQFIKNEIPAKMMEILFIRYLVKKGWRKEAQELMKAFNTRITRDKKGTDAFSNLKYCVGSFVGSQYADIIDSYYIEDLFQFIYQSDFRFLLQKSSIHFDGISIAYDSDENFENIFHSI